MQVLASYRWPGNVRELGNLVERLAIVKPEGTIDVSDLPAKYLDDENRVVGEIEQAMAATDGVVAKAARLLNMRRTTLVEKLGKYSLN